MELNGLGRALLGIGLLLAVAGVLLIGLSRIAGGHTWRVPGDLVFRRDNVTVYVPLGTSILISVILTLVLYVVSLFARR